MREAGGGSQFRLVGGWKWILVAIGNKTLGRVKLRLQYNDMGSGL